MWRPRCCLREETGSQTQRVCRPQAFSACFSPGAMGALQGAGRPHPARRCVPQALPQQRAGRLAYSPHFRAPSGPGTGSPARENQGQLHPAPAS